MTPTAPLASLLQIANPADAAFLQRYFKTGKGEYGEGDVFLGIRVPVLRQLARQFETASRREVAALLRSKYHEARLLGLLVLVRQHEQAQKRADEKTQRDILAVYLAHTRYINNWDLVDLSAPNIIGPHVSPKDFHLLEVLAASPLVWERRMAMLATHHWIRQGEHGPALKIAAMLLGDSHDLMHKAVGWMLREVGKRDEMTLVVFLKKHYTRLPRTALRYAIERFDAATRARYLAGRF